MNNIKKIILEPNRKTFELQVRSSKTITITGKSGIALARKRSSGKINEGDIVSQEEKFITGCKSGDKIILELVYDCIRFNGEILTVPC